MIRFIALLIDLLIGIFGPGVEALFGGARSPLWAKASKGHLVANPKCVCCGKKATAVHHVIPFHVRPDLELDPKNWASVCAVCHFYVGHLLNWKSYNPHFRQDASLMLSRFAEAAELSNRIDME